MYHHTQPRIPFAFQSQIVTIDQAYTTWNSLSIAITQILNGNASKLRFEELYRNAYNLVLHKHGQLLYDGVIELLTKHCTNIAHNTHTHIQSHRNICDNSSNILQYILDQYQLHCMYMGLIRDILMYMDNQYCKSTPNTRTIYDAGILLFQNIVVRDAIVLDTVRKLLLYNIACERNNGITDKILIKNSITMLITCNINSLTLYCNEFEQYYLNETTAFYIQQSQQHITVSTVSSYTESVQEWMNREEQRCELYMHDTTRNKLKLLLCDVLIIQYAQQLIHDQHSGIIHMYSNNMYKELSRMYTLYSKSQCVELIRDQLSVYIKQLGHTIINNYKQSKSQPSQLVTDVLELRQKYMHIIDTSYQSDRSFHKCLKDSFELFINIDSRTTMALCDYIDKLLSRSIKCMPVNDIDNELNNTINLFVYIHDKDIFELHYKQQLMNRLLNSTHINDEVEKLMIGKLKAESGYQFTSRLEGMFKDIQLSKHVTIDYAQHQKQSVASNDNTSHAELVINVLTTGFWPIQQSTTNPETNKIVSLPSVIVPAELQSIITQFNTYYMNIHSGRRLSYQYQYGTVELRYNSLNGRKELLITTYQAIILLLFNHKQSYTFSEIIELTNVPIDELSRHILSLAHPAIKLLRKTPNTKTNEPHHVYTINTQYTTPLYRNKIPLLSRQSIQSDPNNTSNHQTNTDSSMTSTGDTVHNTELISDSRKHAVDASIVRIMKSRKTLDHSLLIGDVLKQCSHKFIVEPTFIKKRIESLIERDYIERDKENRRLYHYLT